ncbi:tetratricopeptide repeat protein [Dactylosporangium sp. NPDC005572]|uniref:tetratricopeptide repeat protein n=1 Tax=Dactylosporangium sp. NPDC005572 TaxID=3156889 RepID=UPI0033A4CC4F
MDPVDEAVALHEQALSMWDDHRYPQTADLCRRALDLLEAHAGAYAGSADVANVLTLLGSAEDELGRHGPAEARHRRAVALMSALPASATRTGDLLRLRVQAEVGLAGCLRRQGRYAEAERVYRTALATAAPRWSELELVPIRNELGILYKYAGRLDEAQACYEAALRAVPDPGHPALAAVWHNLAGLAHSRGAPVEGEAYARRSLALHRAAYPPDHPAVVADEAHLGALLQAAGRPDEAEPLLRRAIDYFTARHGPDHVDVLTAVHNLAAVHADRGARAEAERLYHRALAGKRRAFGPDHPEVALTLNNLAALSADPAEARALATEAHRILEPRVTPDHPVLRSLTTYLGAAA